MASRYSSIHSMQQQILSLSLKSCSRSFDYFKPGWRSSFFLVPKRRLAEAWKVATQKHEIFQTFYSMECYYMCISPGSSILWRLRLLGHIRGSLWSCYTATTQTFLSHGGLFKATLFKSHAMTWVYHLMYHRRRNCAFDTKILNFPGVWFQSLEFQSSCYSSN